MPNQMSRYFREKVVMGVCSSSDLSKAAVREFCVNHNNGQLYQTVQYNLSIEEERAKDIAAHVAFSLAGGTSTDPNSVISDDEFSKFKKKWIDDPQGNQRFMMHTVFSSQDTNMNGFIDADELDGMATLFFDGSWIKSNDPRMKHFTDKEHFKRIIHDKCDLNRDGKFSFEEMVGVISGQLDLSGTEAQHRDKFTDKVLDAAGAGGEALAE